MVRHRQKSPAAAINPFPCFQEDESSPLNTGHFANRMWSQRVSFTSMGNTWV